MPKRTHQIALQPYAASRLKASSDARELLLQSTHKVLSTNRRKHPVPSHAQPQTWLALLMQRLNTLVGVTAPTTHDARRIHYMFAHTPTNPNALLPHETLALVQCKQGPQNPLQAQPAMGSPGNTQCFSIGAWLMKLLAPEWPTNSTRGRLKSRNQLLLSAASQPTPTRHYIMHTAGPLTSGSACTGRNHAGSADTGLISNTELGQHNRSQPDCSQPDMQKTHVAGTCPGHPDNAAQHYAKRMTAIW